MLTWQCSFCLRHFLDGDVHSRQDAVQYQLPVEIAERWIGQQPVCEDCGSARNIPKDY